MKIITFEIDTLDSLTILECAGVTLMYTNMFQYISIIKVKYINGNDNDNIGYRVSYWFDWIRDTYPELYLFTTWV